MGHIMYKTTEEIMDENKNKKDPIEEYLPPRNIENKDHSVQITAVKFEDLKGMTSSDQTGIFPHPSAKGNRYVMAMEDSDTRPILATGIKSRKKEHLITGFTTMYNKYPQEGRNQPNNP